MDLSGFAIMETISINGIIAPVLDIPMMRDKKRKRYISADTLEKAKEIQMTDRQRDVWNLYVMGVSTIIIAGKLGISPGGVDSAVNQIFLKVQGKSCKYANDCFHCPMPDCVLSQQQASITNLLPTDKYTSLWRK